jgi:hypothetical protein
MNGPRSSMTSTAQPRVGSATGGRIAGLLTAAGSALYILGLALPIGGEVYQSIGDGDEAGALTLLSESGAQWDLSTALNALGIAIAAAGLWMLGRDTVRVSAQARVRRAGALAAWLGLLSGVGVVGQVWLIVASPQEVVDGISSFPLVIAGGLAISLGLWGAFLGIGLSLIWNRHLRALGWALVVLGTLTIPTHAFIGPPASYLLLLVAGAILAAAPVRDNSAGARLSSTSASTA